METNRFHSVARFFANRRLSRRQVVMEGGTAPAATGVTAAAAQDATPGAEDGSGQSQRAMLFVQAFQEGSIAAKEGAEGRYILSLGAGSGQTVYFSDRPDRVVGSSPTPQFLEGLGFPPDNPPNAALVVETAPGESDVAVVELFNPLYDPVGRGVTYEVEVLADWQDELGMGLNEAPADLAALAPSFGAAHLFIDDCPNMTIYCERQSRFERPAGTAGQWDNQETCWNYSVCMPCEPYGHVQPDKCATVKYWKDRCNNEVPDCDGHCYPETNWPWAMEFC